MISCLILIGLILDSSILHRFAIEKKKKNVIFSCIEDRILEFILIETGKKRKTFSSFFSFCGGISENSLAPKLAAIVSGWFELVFCFFFTIFSSRYCSVVVVVVAVVFAVLAPSLLSHFCHKKERKSFLLGLH